MEEVVDNKKRETTESALYSFWHSNTSKSFWDSVDEEIKSSGKSFMEVLEDFNGESR